VDKLKCIKCKQDAIIVVDDNTKPYCEKHFVEYFEKKVFQTVREYSMIKKNDHVAVGLSGGKDSTTLLYVLAKLQKKLPFKLSAILIDEGIKGYRDKAYIQAKKQAKKLNIPLFRISFKEYTGKSLDKIVKLKQRSGSCTYCGVFRRYLLNKTAKKIKATKLAIGHNLDDIAQTIILNVIRNEPKRLLRFGPNSPSSSEDFIPRIQPLAKLAEIEVATYALIKKLNMHFEDCPYAQEAMRQKVREIVNELEDRYPGTKKRIFNFLKTLQQNFGQANKEKKIFKCAICSMPSSSKICMACKLKNEINQKN
jgi:uncharacterized protein (TIGR00269 family)